MNHNNEIPQDIRQENYEYNHRWISSHGMVGSGIVSKENLDVHESVKADASPFMVVWLKNIDRLIERLPNGFEFGRYTLLDVGCGSGISTIYFFKNFQFKRVKGFDFSASLICAAVKNREHLISQGSSVESISFEVGDAKSYRLTPNEPTCLFMFNPFGGETMRAFIENNIGTLRASRSLLLYANDLCIDQVCEYGNVLSRDDFYNLSVVGFGT